MLMLFIALVAALFPISLLWKVRDSTVSQIHSVVDRQPSLRELFPEATFREKDWFDSVANWDEVDYVIPSILNGMMTVEVLGTALDLLPSSSGDPVTRSLYRSIDEHIMRKDWIILTSQASQQLSVSKGDSISLDLYRSDGTEVQTVQFAVVGILGSEKDELSRGYVSLTFLEQLEDYRIGLEVKSRAWPSQKNKGINIQPKFDGVVLAAENTRDLPNSSDVIFIPRNRAASLLGVEELPSMAYAQLIHPNINTADDIERLHKQFQSTGLSEYVKILPFSNPYISGSSEKHTWIWKNIADVEALHIASDFMLKTVSLDKTERRVIEFPIKAHSASKICVDGKLLYKDLTTEIPCEYSDNESLYYKQATKFAKLNWALENGYTYSAYEGWIPSKRQYAGFRIYAKSLETIDTLRNRLREEGVGTVTNQSFAASFLELDKSLRKYLIILSIFIVAGTISVISMNFAAIARMQNETYALLRQFGVSKYSVLSIPCIYVFSTIVPAWIIAEFFASVFVGPIVNAFELVPGSSQLNIKDNSSSDSVYGSFYLLLSILLASFLLVVVSTGRLLSQPISSLFNS